MKHESFIDNDFFYSKGFKKLLDDAKDMQIEAAKAKIDEFYFSQNPLRKLKLKKTKIQKTESFRNF